MKFEKLRKLAGRYEKKSLNLIFHTNKKIYKQIYIYINNVT